jgi:hypothetical protein
LDWYQKNLGTIETTMSDGIFQMKKDNVTKVESISALSQSFEKDGVHLTKESGKCFLSVVLEQAEAFFKAEFVNLSDANTESETES